MEGSRSLSPPHALLTTKLCCPKANDFWLQRPQLHSLLNESFHHTLTLIQAPAGYGKTTAVAQWYQQLESAKGWISLDELDNDFPKFFSYVQALIQNYHQQENPADIFQDWSKISTNNGDHIVDFFLQQLAGLPEKPVLVLDDLHWIVDPAILETIETLLYQSIGRIHLICISRTQLSLNIQPLLLADEVQFINVQDLQFSHIETAQFLQQCNSDSEVNSKLIAEIAGWPAGLQLFRMARKNQLPIAQEQTIVRDYLVTEFIEHLPDDLKTFAFKAAISRRFNHSLLRTLMQVTEVEGHLEALLTRYGVIEQAGGDQQQWFRFHSLFRHALIDAYKKSAWLNYQQTLHASAQWWLQHAHYSEAAEHFIELGNTELIREVLIAHGWQFYRTGQYRLLKACFGELGQDDITGHPTLALTYAWWSLIEEDPKRADNCLRTSANRITLSPQNEASYNAVRSAIAIIFDDFTAAARWAERALNSKEKPRPWEHCHAFLASAEAHIHQCEFASAREDLQAANSLCMSEQYTTLQIQVLYLTAEIHGCRSEWREAELILESALTQARTKGLSKLFSRDHLERSYARLQRIQGKVGQATSLLKQMDTSEHVLGDYWQYPINIEQLLSELLKEQHDELRLKQLSKQLQYLAMSHQFSMKWQLPAERAQILFWTLTHHKRALFYQISRYESAHYPGLRFSLNAQFNLALAKLGVHEIGDARNALEVCEKGAQMAGYSELETLCRIMLVVIEQHESGSITNHSSGSASNLTNHALYQGLKNLYAIAWPKGDETSPDTEIPLTRTEKKVADLLTKNLTNREVAEALGVATSTIRSHIKAINRKRARTAVI